MKVNLWTKITMLFVSYLCLADMVIIPAIGGIYADLPDANPVLLNFLMTGPFLTAIFSSLLCGFLAKYFSNKALLIGAYIIGIIGTCAGGLFVNIYYLAAMRALVGISLGIIGVAAIGLISEVYADEAERSSMIGLYYGVMAGFGIVLSFLSGFLAVGGWQNSFYLYLVGIPIFIMMIAFLPKTTPGEAEKQVAVADRMPIARMSILAITFFLFNALYCVVCYYIALYLEEIQLGDASTAGMLASLGTIGSLCGSLVFSFVYLRIKGVTPTIAYLVMAAAYIVLSFPSNINIWTIGVMCLMAGVAYGLGQSYFFMHTSMIVPPSLVALAISIITISLNAGTFCAPYALDIYKYILHVQTMAPTFLYIGITLGILGVLSIISNVRSTQTSISSDVNINK